jgi:hypothetical protein
MLAVLQELAANLDERRMSLSKVRRIVASLDGHTLEHTAIEMSIPLVYAQWEGYAKEACTLYLRAIEKIGTPLCELKEELVAYVWSRELSQVQSKPQRERKCVVVRLAVETMTLPFALPDHLATINTRSNLNFDTLTEVCQDLALECPSAQIKKRLDSLIHVRNNIAHGSSPSSMSRAVFEQHAETAIDAMEILDNRYLRVTL